MKMVLKNAKRKITFIYQKDFFDYQFVANECFTFIKTGHFNSDMLLDCVYKNGYRKEYANNKYKYFTFTFKLYDTTNVELAKVRCEERFKK